MRWKNVDAKTGTELIDSEIQSFQSSRRSRRKEMCRKGARTAPRGWLAGVTFEVSIPFSPETIS